MTTAAKPKIGAIAPWFGGKRTLAPLIIQQLGDHTAYFEPFCGSMAVLFAKPESSHELANDLHGHLINLARVIQSEELRPWLFNELQATLYSSDIFEQSRKFIESICPTVDVDAMPSASAAYHYFIVSWMGRNGVSGTKRVKYQKATRWTPGGGSGPTRFRSAIDSIPAWAERLRNVDIQCRDGFDLLGRISDEDGVVVYADPPYTHAQRGGARYQHDFADGQGGIFSHHDDHTRLHKALDRFDHARVIVSYYDDPLIRELYSGWTFIECPCQKNLHVQNRRGNGTCEAPEVLIVNGKAR